VFFQLIYLLLGVLNIYNSFLKRFFKTLNIDFHKACFALDQYFPAGIEHFSLIYFRFSLQHFGNFTHMETINEKSSLIG